VLIMSQLIKLDIPSPYKDRLAVALTRINQNEKYLHLIKDPYYLSEALIHLGKIDDAKRIIELKRKIPKHAYLSSLIFYIMMNQSSKLLQLMRIIKKHQGTETLIEYLKQTTVYTGSSTALRILYDQAKHIELDIKSIPKSHLKEIKEGYLANILNTVHLLRLESPIKGILDIINQTLNEEISPPFRMVCLSMLTSYYSRWDPIKMNQPYNELIEMLQGKPRLAEAPFIHIIFANLMASGKNDEAGNVLRRLVNILTQGIKKRIDKFVKMTNILSSSKKQKAVDENLISSIANEYAYLMAVKQRIMSIFILLLGTLQNLVRVEIPINLERIEELAAAGIILTSDIEFVEPLFQTWIKQGYHDLAEEEIKETIRRLKDEDTLEAFFHSLGKIYANKQAGRIRNTIEKILIKRKRKETLIKAFIDALYTETLYIYKITTS